MPEAPSLRKILPLKRGSTLQFEDGSSANLQVDGELRILQFNVLADGLSGLRPDFGGFARVPDPKIMFWEHRKTLILHEILQYNPDVITLQECDHFYDFFLPKLNGHGYSGVFAPKPMSTCLEVSNNCDGCCIFVKNEKLLIKSAQTISFRVTENRATTIQNQVAIIAICKFKSNLESKTKTQDFIISTTHLKATKTEEGEKIRLNQIAQLFEEILSISELNKQIPIIISGDFNASPTLKSSENFNNLVYPFIKNHPFSLKSVLNDDLTSYYNENGENKEIWTTWKARMKKDSETIVKHCIDYIFYNSVTKETNIGVRAVGVLDIFADNDKEIEGFLLPNVNYPSDHIAILADLQIIQKLQ